MRVVFMGSPEFAVPSLSALLGAGHDIVGVFTQPDRPTGRGRKLAPPPVKEFALARDLRVFQPRSISKPAAVEQMRRLAPDVGVIAAYGQILKQPVLDVPRLGVLNVHASLLPRWRGAAPVTAAILAGDAESGATIMSVVLALDAGPMLDAVRVPIAPDDTTGTLTDRIAIAGAELLVDVLPRYAQGEVKPVEQDDAIATYAPQIEKSDALIDWAADDAVTVERKVRAYNPWPVAYGYLDGKPFRIFDAVRHEHQLDLPPGTIFSWSEGSAREWTNVGIGPATRDGAMSVATRDGTLTIHVLQPPGGKRMSAAAYLHGHRDILGKRLSAQP